ncbi:coenzyme A pyrophosphatase [Sporosarcina sp. P37]|uniref:NUDIX hydrolase n=1 Tax=unclassified Sporosarcina TaxID=2647733 RepID=UPI0009C16109|nr:MULTISPECIES: CoA pyrophosphatase [unclassified Sporosarcina]ARD48348.1 coenzyme A pyrophosphatase [Sporosarcina sp. P33]ARK24853.1 coenzyme A pyrophosphatase [Sporosarcina sp. P37]PID20011.1 CoA pyrophosphatase [Sporosarcina sp. P35]
MDLEQLQDKLYEHKSLFIGEETAFRSAVIIPLVEAEGEWHVLFEVRSLTMRKQPGDVSFPGGKIDVTDASPMEAALRETQEELGIEPKTVQVVGELSPYIASPSFVVYPFVAVIDYHEIIRSYNKDEVEEVFTIPLKWLLEHEPYMHLVSIETTPQENFPFEKIMNGERYQFRKHYLEEWFYEYKTYTVWGLTARLLKHFIEITKR